MQLALFTPEPKPLPKNFQGFLNFYRKHRDVFEEFVRRSKAIKPDQQLLSECKQIDQELNATEHQRA